MNAIAAVFEQGVFRPVGPVDLPEGTRVVVETEVVAAERVRAARSRVHEILSRTFDSAEPANILETHNHHQP